MSQHPSLRSSDKDKKHRSVLKRYERIKTLQDKEKWDEKKDSVFGLPKVKVTRFKIKKEKAVAAEAIKDEFLKGIKSAKSPAGFLELYDHFGLLTKYIFPGLHVDQVRPNSHNPVLVIAGLLHKNSPEQIARGLFELKYSNDEIGKVEYLVNLLNLRQGRLGPVLGERPHYLYGLRKSQPEVSDEDLETWAKWHGLDSQALRAFRQHSLKNRQDVPGAMDLQGTEIGKLITHHNTQEMLQKLGFREWLQ